ncbi:hypothetical protein ASG32_27255 [Methylobacterium sp. Leaf361]|uniref:hypothetical protein n=1 Tax=Methylobacterium sp. Leaf361 TaxID=1736352 RepID=UPI0006FEC5B0|nr:hypothetical protein [Methylobacterium sp. Leaf361]KQS75464.1 hypothetical protein ASG32_27255 [Methylobacterium sp. Leaf361]
MAETVRIEKTIFAYESTGISEQKAKVEQLAGALDRLAGSTGKASEADNKAASSNQATTRTRLTAAEAMQRLERQNQIAMMNAAVTANAYDQSLSALADQQLRASQAAAQAASQQQRAANDNAASLEKQNEAFKAAGKFALEHPLLVIAASVAAARGLATLATSAAGSLGAASASTAAFAEGASAMGPTVVAAATIAARGLGLASTAATAAAGGLGVYAEKVAGITTATGLMSRLLGGLPGAIGPAVVAFLAFETARAAISSAGADLERLISLGEKARSLDLAAPFVKSFEALGPKIQATTDQMDRALQTASNFVKDRYGQANGALSAVSSLYTSGAFGAEKPAAMSALETATTTQERIRATLDLVKELYDRGQEVAGLDLAEKLMGPDVAERLRNGSTNISQMVADFNSLQDKEILKQDQVDRALELNKNIADTKQAISDAVAVTFDFSGAALAANEAWLKVLQTVLLVIQKVNEANQASSDFVGTATTTMIDGLKSAGAAAVDLAAKYGLVAKAQKEAEVQGPPEVQGPEFKITGRSFPYNFGPTLADLPKATSGAKQAKQAAQEAASSYDLLIKRTEDRIDELNLEAESVGKTTDAVIKLKLAHDLERAAQKEGTEVTAQMREEWDRLGDRLAASTSRLADNKRAFELLKEGQRELADGFTSFVDDIVLGGQKMEQAFASLSKSLGSSTLKALISGEGPLAGILGTASNERGQLGGLLGGKFNFGACLAGARTRPARRCPALRAHPCRRPACSGACSTRTRSRPPSAWAPRPASGARFRGGSRNPARAAASSPRRSARA